VTELAACAPATISTQVAAEAEISDASERKRKSTDGPTRARAPKRKPVDPNIDVAHGGNLPTTQVTKPLQFSGIMEQTCFVLFSLFLC